MSQTTILSDPFRVRQVLVNLITNALKFTDRGNVEIGAERWGDQAVFWVKDSGIGMSQENLLVIFDRFRQVAKTASTHTNGFGLGLAISKMLIELLGGHIWLESELNNGTVFYFTIPYSTPKPTEMNNTNTGETAFPYDWKGRTILIAEDIDFSFLYIEAVLRRTGARVLWAQNGREAIEMVKVNPGIDIALMDIHMPVMNGYEATREIIKIRPDLPVIAQTAFVLPDDVKACYAAGCAGYLAKPIRREQLLNTLTDYFEKIDQNAQVQSGNMPVYRSKISG
jgi:CheY-like chemotaxis protein